MESVTKNRQPVATLRASLHLMLIMTIETVYRGHTDAGQYNWARGQLTDVMALFGRLSV